MKMTSCYAVGMAVAVGVVGIVPVTAAQADNGILDYVRPIASARMRYEYVAQDNYRNDAKAPTVRARVGLETKPIYGFSLLAEGEFTGGLNNTYNSTTNGRTGYPVVPDPDNAELNRLLISYSNNWANATLGRQKLTFDNARFVGPDAWRQNEQTFDAAYGSVLPVDGLTLSYAYVDRVQTVYGVNSDFSDYDSNSHLIHANYSHLQWLDASAYAYLLDLKDAPLLSSQTYGGRAVGTFGVEGDAKIRLVAEYANQSDYGDNPGSYSVNYYQGSIGAEASKFRAAATVEILGSDAGYGFSTPLASLHAFQGWADVFSITPSVGVRDLYGQVGYSFGKAGPFQNIEATGMFHRFNAADGGEALGTEFDLAMRGSFNQHLALTLAYAGFNAPSGTYADDYPSRNKLWFQIDFNY